ncbi:MAG TPA: hypothetical protein PKL83_06840 [bacterium]|nr:hypothetical protein [bacterium]
MSAIEEILQSSLKPKEKQTRLVKAIVSGAIPVKEFMAFFQSATGAHKGTCADVMKHVSEQKPALLAPYLDILIKHVNFPLPRVKWGVPEAIGNLAKEYPAQAAKAIPNLLRNTTDDPVNTTVIRWCAAFALAEIAKNHPASRKQLVPVFEQIITREKNTGVKNLYVQTLKMIKKDNERE